MEFVVADLVWRCRWCDYQREARHPPQACPGCDGPNWFKVARASAGAGG
jgi:rubrerythrin